MHVFEHRLLLLAFSWLAPAEGGCHVLVGDFDRGAEARAHDALPRQVGAQEILECLRVDAGLPHRLVELLGRQLGGARTVGELVVNFCIADARRCGALPPAA